MKDSTLFSRRAVVKSSVFGLLGVSIPSIGYARNIGAIHDKSEEGLFHRYPSIDDTIVQEVVGASHFNFERVQELVNHRPELARATWDWGFGDWETAIGAASHVGRRDIAEFLLSKGARPDIFTYAMLGSYEAVKQMLEDTPSVTSIDGPHGISLLSHAKYGLRSDELTEKQKESSNKLIAYIESLNIEVPSYIELSEDARSKYLGDYMYGDGPKDGFSIKLNMRKNICLGKLGAFGGGLNQKSPNLFLYNGISSVEISFKIENDVVKSLTLTEPDLTLTAKKVS